jgi:DNA-binding MarR family transcriptional regulator
MDRRAGDEIEYISGHLVPAAVSLARLLVRAVPGAVSLTEAGVLRALSPGPRRITELAEREGLAQPTTTLLVKRLEEQGLVRRERQLDDQRVVLVWLTDAGERALEHLRTGVHDALRTHLEAMAGERVDALASATNALDDLSAALLRDARGPA